MPAPVAKVTPATNRPATGAKPAPVPQNREHNSDEPYIAPQGTDVPLRRERVAEPPRLGQTQTPTPDGNAKQNSTGAGPLPQRVPLPSESSDGTARVEGRPAVQVPRVGGIGVSGLSNAAALQRLRLFHSPVLRQKVVLSDGIRTWTLRRDQLGATLPLASLLQEARRRRIDVPLRFVVDTKVAEAALSGLAKQVNRVTPVPQTGVLPVGTSAARTSQRLKLAIAGSVLRVEQALEAEPARNTVDLVVSSTPVTSSPATSPALNTTPSSTQTAVKPLFKAAPYLLASFSTPYDSKIVGRTQNLKLAARNMNGTVVKPGSVFSTNLTIGRRNAAAGWKEAKMFMGGRVVSGIGSGICQGATTIYNAALLAGLPIVERHPHSFRISYAPASRDATIYWGSKDLRFRNNTPGPIYVRTFLKANQFYVELYGVQPVKNQIEVSSRIVSTGAKKGTRSEAFRLIRTASGESKRERLSSDYYRPHP
jgi:hypothetical protein